MKPKHVSIRVEQVLALAKASNCVQHKAAALLIDPTRNVVLMDGYSGGPRGGTLLCGGPKLCVREGLRADEVRIVGTTEGLAKLYVKGTEVTPPLALGLLDCGVGWARKLCEDYRDKLLSTFEPIPAGTKMEAGCHHAEINVVANAAANGVKTSGAWLFSTHEPCLMCAKLLHHAGVGAVVVVQETPNTRGEGAKYLLAHGISVKDASCHNEP